jgi:hypothetical protein
VCSLPFFSSYLPSPFHLTLCSSYPFILLVPIYSSHAHPHVFLLHINATWQEERDMGALTFAIRSGNLPVIDLLIKRGALVNDLRTRVRSKDFILFFVYSFFYFLSILKKKSSVLLPFFDFFLFHECFLYSLRKCVHLQVISIMKMLFTGG